MSKPQRTSVLMRLSALASLLLAFSALTAISTGAANAKPAVDSLSVSRSRLPDNGGLVNISAEVKNATTCSFTIVPTISRGTKKVPCGTGLVRDRVTLPANTSKKARRYTIHLVVRGPGGVATAPLKRVTVMAAPKPIIKSLTTSVAGLPNAGGAISLVALVTNATSCHITVSPAINGFSGDVPCGSGLISVPIVMPANSSLSQINYVFRLTVNGDVSAVSKTLTVTVYSTSTVPTTTTTTPPPTTTTTTPPVSTGNTISVPAGPEALISVGPYIWVASCKANAVTEINSSTKQVIQVLNSPTYGFNCPVALAYDGTHIWVANQYGNSLSQLDASTGAWIKTITGSNIYSPIALAVAGSNLWVINPSSGPAGAFLSAFNTASGAIAVTGGSGSTRDGWTLVSPTSLTSTGSDIWVADAMDNSLAEFSGTTGAFLRTTSGGPSLSGPVSVSSHSGYVWVANLNDSLVEEYNASDGRYVNRSIAATSPTQIIFTGSDLFVISNDSSTIASVLEYSSTGTFIRTVAKFKQANVGSGIILFDGNNLWVAIYSNNTATKYPL